MWVWVFALIVPKFILWLYKLIEVIELCLLLLLMAIYSFTVTFPAHLIRKVSHSHQYTPKAKLTAQFTEKLTNFYCLALDSNSILVVKLFQFNPLFLENFLSSFILIFQSAKSCLKGWSAGCWLWCKSDWFLLPLATGDLTRSYAIGGWLHMLSSSDGFCGCLILRFWSHFSWLILPENVNFMKVNPYL